MNKVLPKIIRTNSFVFINYTTIPETDSRILWQARNDDRIRCYMENSEKFSWEAHCRFVEILNRKDGSLYYAVYQRFASNAGGGGNCLSKFKSNKLDCSRIGIRTVSITRIPR